MALSTLLMPLHRPRGAHCSRLDEDESHGREGEAVAVVVMAVVAVGSAGMHGDRGTRACRERESVGRARAPDSPRERPCADRRAQRASRGAGGVACAPAVCLFRSTEAWAREGQADAGRASSGARGVCCRVVLVVIAPDGTERPRGVGLWSPCLVLASERVWTTQKCGVPRSSAVGSLPRKSESASRGRDTLALEASPRVFSAKFPARVDGLSEPLRKLFPGRCLPQGGSRLLLSLEFVPGG